MSHARGNPKLDSEYQESLSKESYQEPTNTLPDAHS